MAEIATTKFGVAQWDYWITGAQSAILDREALQGGFGGPLGQSSHAVSIPVV